MKAIMTVQKLRKIIRESLENNDPKKAIEKLEDIEAEILGGEDALVQPLDYTKIMTGEENVDQPETLDMIVKEVKRRIAEKKDQNKDGKNDFDDVKIARMKASGMSDEEIKKKHPELFKETVGDLVGKILSKIATAKDDEEPQVLGGGGTARMAKQHLYQLATTAQSLHDKLDDDDELPEWCQSKIAVAESSIDAVAEHLGYKMKRMDQE